MKQINEVFSQFLIVAWVKFRHSHYYVSALDLLRRGHFVERVLQEIYTIGYNQGVSDSLCVLCESDELECESDEQEYSNINRIH